VHTVHLNDYKQINESATAVSVYSMHLSFASFSALQRSPYRAVYRTNNNNNNNNLICIAPVCAKKTSVALEKTSVTIRQ